MKTETNVFIESHQKFMREMNDVNQRLQKLLDAYEDKNVKIDAGTVTVLNDAQDRQLGFSLTDIPVKVEVKLPDGFIQTLQEVNERLDKLLGKNSVVNVNISEAFEDQWDKIAKNMKKILANM